MKIGVGKRVGASDGNEEEEPRVGASERDDKDGPRVGATDEEGRRVGAIDDAPTDVIHMQYSV